LREYSADQKETVFFTGRKLVVKSGAGSGKTTILKGYALQNPRERFLYLCYNSAIQKEASAAFPGNVICRTGHAIAMGVVGRPLEHKLVDNLRLTDIKNYIKAKDWGLTKDVSKGLSNFLNSSRSEISIADLNFLPNFSSSQKKRNRLILSCIQKIWDAGLDASNPFPVTHDMYLKKFCMGPATMHQWFSGILFDEVQDANPVIADWVFKQDKCKHILVGDDHQQLYRWRGAQNFMDDYAKKTGCQVNTMPQSYRFGNKTADIATKLLDYKSKITKCARFPVYGNAKINDEVYAFTPALFRTSHRTVLHRTVIATLDTAIQNIDKKIFWVGKISSYGLQGLLDVFYLKKDMKDKVRNKRLLTEHRSFASYQSMAEETKDSEMLRTIKLLEKHGSSIPSKINALQRNAVEDESLADVTVSTAHRSKGLEWDHVELADDYPDLLDVTKDWDVDIVGDEINLLYVSVTRAMKRLKVSDIVIELFKKMGGDVSIFTSEIEEAGPPGNPVRDDNIGVMNQRVKLNEKDS
tara:strand:- start:165 stop:1736 length:1572 start_codon:yes stop_codon:yes gene_type:complete